MCLNLLNKALRLSPTIAGRPHYSQESSRSVSACATVWITSFGLWRNWCWHGISRCVPPLERVMGSHDHMQRRTKRSQLLPVGIELRRASCRWRVTGLALSICEAGSHFHHGHVSGGPPYNPGRPDFPWSGLKPWLSSVSLPILGPRFKHWFAYAPSSVVHPASRPGQHRRDAGFIRLVRRNRGWTPARAACQVSDRGRVRGRGRCESRTIFSW